ncbi:FAD binding domain-containing protein [Paraphysoderma sedebokerense]|nr:FAD binding domain-containing protein [Paraphysoderma sedebokerense]KAI9145769.1 FAD binding domain-containing protein [Paraphysoderma sedebokerense]
MQQVDVLVVGAGPVGLFFGACLKRSNPTCSIRIIDKAPSCSLHSKALAIQSRSLEEISYLGEDVVRQVIESGIKCNKITIFDGHKGRTILQAVSDDVRSVFNYILLMPQFELERILEECCADKYGIQVERNAELLSFRELGDKIVAELQLSGKTEEVECKYLIGADGAHSTVRHLLNIPFDGVKVEEIFAMGDVTVDADWLDGTSPTNFYHDLGTCIFFPLKKNERTFRVLLNLRQDDEILQVKNGSMALKTVDKHDKSDSGLTLGQLHSRAQKRLPLPVTFSNPRWLTIFTCNERIARSYKSGNIFIMGDAAHVHTPVGGQGMNLGMQDGFNLAWKLGLALCGHAKKDVILDSYAQERPDIAKTVVGRSHNLAVLSLRGNLFFRFLRRYALPFLVPRLIQYRLVNINKMVERMLQLDFTYRGNGPLISNRSSRLWWWQKDISTMKAGCRAPSKGVLLSIVGEPITITPLQCYSRTTKHVLCCFGLGGAVMIEKLKECRTSVNQIKEHFGASLECHFLLRDGADLETYKHISAINSTIMWDGQWLDVENQVVNYYGFRVSEGVIFALVRPDGYVGTIIKSCEREYLVNLLSSYLN